MSAATGTQYDTGFFDYISKMSGGSAQVIVPLVVDMVRPSSVIDVGCGEGVWLAAFIQAGVSRFVGLDGDYVQRERLLIPKTAFAATDLSRPFRYPERFDLVVSLEVAEHLPATSAGTFVESLVELGDVVLFSAAIPGQGGTDHLNEAWPDYWAGLFRERGYMPVDAIRPKIWRNGSVAVWYQQNILLFVAEHCLRQPGPLSKAREWTRDDQLSVVHPTLYNRYAIASPPPRVEDLSVRSWIRGFPKVVRRAIGRRLGARS